MLANETQPITNFKIPSEWTYRGEGNCNVVLSLPNTRKILRIRKADRPKSLIGWLIVWISDFLYWYCGTSVREELRDLKFYSGIMRALIGWKYTSEATQVILSRKQVKVLENELSKFRPGFRKTKVLQYGRAALFEDFAFLPQEYLPFKVADDTFAVEIKPKQGWKPLNERHFPKCLYCMNQHLKMETKRIREYSKYCPEDLFSGNAVRMRNAINSLIEMPQNNFRIFKNGVLCYGEKVRSDFAQIIPELFETSNESTDRLREEFCDLIQRCLLTNLINASSCDEKLFCEWNKIIRESNVQTILPTGCVLERILSTQMLDAEGSYYYNKLLRRDNFQDWTYMNLLLSKVNTSNACMKCTIMLLGNTDRRTELTFVPYIISAIAKDCSLMITLRKITETVSEELELKNSIKTRYGHYVVNIGVFDLYPKPFSIIKKHCKRNKDLLQAYVRASRKST